ncbi:unnamed protein product [Euphydryas editha]|uniref:Zinc finger double-stranded RNA binding domain-containing protein n=1 Tax=Euphydryas editha TaxID=104508 RepID=A0AAU9UJT5_EUPED|nr:unnamed protein product [Euphydryas editha]
MELPDCPPGAEGYQDSVTEVPKKPEIDEETVCTKAEQEFQQHLNSLKIKTEDGNIRCMVERRGRDISGKWIYLCYPCAAMCSGESILQTHISGKKHKSKLSMKSIWPLSIFEEHPYVLNEKGISKTAATEKVLQKMAEEVENFKKTPTELDMKYEKYRNVRCHIQETLDNVKAPLLGVEYLIEHPPEEEHYEPSYICVLCVKQGHPRTIVNHLTCFWHRFSYLQRHFGKACALLAPFRLQPKHREGATVIMNRLAARIQDKYGRLRPVNIEKDVYERERNDIHQWIFKGTHFSETDDCTFEEVVDADLITSLNSFNKQNVSKHRDPSPPIVAAPSKPSNYNDYNRQVVTVARVCPQAGRRAPAAEPLSDVSDESEPRAERERRDHRTKPESKRYEPYPDKRNPENSLRSRYAIRNSGISSKETVAESSAGGRGPRAPNYEYKVKLASEQRAAAEELARKALAYHEKNPEKHPLYPDEWKKFWNRRYKEIQAEGKDPSKHDFKPEWIVFWTTRMKELHQDELRSTVSEIYRRLRLTPPDRLDGRKSPEHRKSSEKRRSSDRVRADRRRSPEPRHRSPAPRRRSPEPRRRSPPRRSFPPPKRDFRDRRSESREGRPVKEGRAAKRARSPLSRRESAPRNLSPARALVSDTVLISDEELKPDDGLSPWNSEESLGSLPDARSPVARVSRAGSVGSRASRASRRPPEAPRPQDFGDADHVVATLRLLVALEDYLGSLGPKIVDLLADALKMEKEKANSSEALLESESAVVLIETAKEKLKGAVQAGLVAGGAAAAVRAAVVRAAATLHEADTRMRKRKEQEAASSASKAAAVPVAGVGAVDREQIAQQMAAALVAQGKTDVTSEELAHLVDAVVGMAEAKKREAESKKKMEDRIMNNKSTLAPTAGTASALQLLQTAYDDKKIEKEDVPDAMDGLSDSDLETLLKNFNELSAEEQHSLIAYLKKLEAREPQRVERLRQYVGEAATNVPTTEEQTKPSNVVSIAIASDDDDDDDYTVEDVFKSATQKVKENQIRQEMEIVKKSLEESNASPKIVESTNTKTTSDEVKLDMFSATDLLALVQASLQSTHAPTVAQTSDVVTSNTQPRSFGDLPEPSKTEMPNLPNVFGTQSVHNQQDLRPPLNISNYGGNKNTNEVRIPVWESRQVLDNRDIIQDNIYNQGMGRPQDNYNQGPQNNYNQSQRGTQEIFDQEPRAHQGNFSQGLKNPQDIYIERSLGPQDNYSQGLRGAQENYNQGLHGAPGLRTPQDNFLQGPREPQDNYNQGSRGPQDNYNKGSRGPQDNYNQGSRGPQDNYNQGLRGPQDNYNQGSRGPQDNYNQGLRGPQDNYNQVSRGPQDNFNQGSRGPQDNYNKGLRGPQDNYNQGSRGPQDNYNQGSRGPQDKFNQGSRLQENFNQGSCGPQDNFNQETHGPQDNSNQGSRGPQDNYNKGEQMNFNQALRNNFNQGSQSKLDGFNLGSRSQDQSYGAGRESSNNTFNQGARGNFMGNRTQDNFNNRQDGPQQPFGGQYGNFDKNNFRGRGRGFSKQTRGRGRGHY